MGSIRKDLYRTQLPSRELHHSRLFIDLAENIHIHHREYRTVFSLDEYFEYADIIAKSTEDVRNFLEQNSTYVEHAYPTTIMIAGGKERQLKFLKNSPNPTTSAYFANDFAIELQDVYVTDEIHIHYRDFRIAMDRDRFRAVAKGFAKSLEVLDDFEKNENYERETHPDRIIKKFNDESADDINTSLMGFKKTPLNKIKSFWFRNLNKEFKPQLEAVKALKKEYNKTGRFTPVILCKDPKSEGQFHIVDGHHRIYVANQLKLENISALILDLSFEETKSLREAELKLKEFDSDTNYKYNLSSYFKSFVAYRLNRFYSDAFKKKMIRQTGIWRLARYVKRLIFGKRRIFKYFNEAHNDHHN